MFNKDPTRKILFQSIISNGINSFNVDCGLWKPSKNELYIFCNADTNIPSGKYSKDFSKVQKFNYQDYSVNLYQYQEIKFEKFDKDIIDLYSDEQKINIVEGQDSYELKFNVVSYNQEVFMNKTLAYVFLDCK